MRATLPPPSSLGLASPSERGGKPRSTEGFTILELVISIGILAVLGTISVLSLNGYGTSQNLQLSINELSAVVQSTQKRSITQENGHGWGIHFLNATGTSQYTVFSGPSFASGTPERTYSLRRGIQFVDPASGTSKDLIFAPETGLPSGYFSILLASQANLSQQRFIAVGANGVLTVSNAVGLSVTGITPSWGSNNAPVAIGTVSGTGFITSSTVQLVRSGQAPISLVGFSVTGPATITGGSFDITNATSGGWSVVVFAGNASATLANGFSVMLPPPLVNSINASSGVSGSNLTSVAISGSSFQAGAFIVKISRGAQAIVGSGFVFANSTSLTGGSLNLSGAPAGAWDVTVVNPDGQSGVLPSGFTVRAATGPVFETAGTGSNMVGYGTCGNATAWTDTEVCVKVPAGSTSGVASTTLTSNSNASNLLTFTVP